ncbi:methyltransferase domain-containing protein [Cyanobium sp. Morenito 9A2]|uniref:methyltransferase domain-containing protein n=1 Tax=Cyanobium sp. Morenito 9A2 TaxID=2823718 RepID=UPI0020CC3674|nr:methyltransferase domain-containing protein [Cyanobium sp. Morenito 9A2]MCP9850435.1 methyltransferase domain-containing protein [Cyanobium sp. Morenito 9A2]
MTASSWDQRYREGRDGWELGQPVPVLARFIATDPRAPQPPAQVLVPGCGRGHEARLLADRGFEVVGLDFSSEALGEARRLYGTTAVALRWLQADLFDGPALVAAGLGAGSLGGVLEHTCFCAIDPSLRTAYARTVAALLEPGGWLLGLFWCHGRPGGPPYGAQPEVVQAQLSGAGLVAELWEPVPGAVAEETSAEAQEGRSVNLRDGEWLGLWRKPSVPGAAAAAS